LSASANPPDVSTHTKLAFLNDDLYDALRWLFVGVVTWEAMRRRPELFCFEEAVEGETVIYIANTFRNLGKTPGRYAR
jgi:uncharacterized membrane protein